MDLRETILAADDLPREKVDVPEWSCAVYVRALTGAERDAFEASVIQDGKATLDNIRAKLVVRSVVDDAGARVFTDADAAALGAKSGKALNRLFPVAQRLGGLTEADVRELAGNSVPGPSDGSTSV